MEHKEAIRNLISVKMHHEGMVRLYEQSSADNKEAKLQEYKDRAEDIQRSIEVLEADL